MIYSVNTSKQLDREMIYPFPDLVGGECGNYVFNAEHARKLQTWGARRSATSMCVDVMLQ